MDAGSPLALGGALVLSGGLALLRSRKLSGQVSSRWKRKGVPVGPEIAKWVVRLLGAVAVVVGAALVLSSLG
jgi:hypothetical protein